MKVIALRGVCIGPGQHLAGPDPETGKPGDEGDVDKATAHYLESIKAVEIVPEPEAAVDADASDADPKPKSAPAKPGKKEK